jgi:hypothetical protein
MGLGRLARARPGSSARLFTKSLPLTLKTPMPYLTVATAALYFGFGEVGVPVNVYIMLILGVIKAFNFIVAIKATFRCDLSIPN